MPTNTKSSHQRVLRRFLGVCIPLTKNKVAKTKKLRSIRLTGREPFPPPRPAGHFGLRIELRGTPLSQALPQLSNQTRAVSKISIFGSPSAVSTVELAHLRGSFLPTPLSLLPRGWSWSARIGRGVESSLHLPPRTCVDHLSSSLSSSDTPRCPNGRICPVRSLEQQRSTPRLHMTFGTEVGSLLFRDVS
jgi:hypothetical protein